MTKTVLITGASRGIGRAAAILFAKAGYRVVINYLNSEMQARELMHELNAAGWQVLAVRADVAERAEVDAMFGIIEQTWGGVDILVNNAGIAQQKLFTELTEADWSRMFAVTVGGAFNCSQCALTYMLQQKQGKIINVSSMWGQIGGSCEVHYSAAKAAVQGLTKALAKELGPSHIQVNCVAPGVIATEMNQHLDQETLAALKEETPLGKIGQPEDVAQMILFLASNQADFMTGQIIGVNGGMVI